jgi:transposase
LSGLLAQLNSIVSGPRGKYTPAIKKKLDSILLESMTYLGAFYQRMKARLGAPKAMTATAHKLAIIFYRMVQDKTPYHDLGGDYYLKQNRERAVRRLKQDAKRFGFELVAQKA